MAMRTPTSVIGLFDLPLALVVLEIPGIRHRYNEDESTRSLADVYTLCSDKQWARALTLFTN